MKRLRHLILALIVLGALWGVSHVLSLRKPLEKQPPPPVIPRVKVVTMKAASIPVSIIANGTVRARTSTQLTSQVSGLITSVSPQFQEGGFFREGEVLVTIDPILYETQIATAKAQLATARLGLESEQALAKRKLRDWQRLGKGEPTGLAANKPQLAKAQADVEAAEATLRSAEHDLAHTQIVAPYTGRIRTKIADVGQSVSAVGAPLADIYAIDYAEVVLPLPASDARFLSLPTLGQATTDATRVPVTLQGEAGDTWHGFIDRSTGIIDSQSRFVRIIVRIEDPYGLESTGEATTPLQIGQFVKANIPGNVLENAFEVPREALLPGDRVLSVQENKIHSRKVTIARKESDRVLVSEGLADGDQVIVTRLSFHAEGMDVAPITSDDDAPKGELIDQVNAQ